MVEEMLAARGISVTHETIRQWASNSAGNSPTGSVSERHAVADKWHHPSMMVVISFAGKKHWLWRGRRPGRLVLDVLVQSRRDKKAAKRLFRKPPQEARSSPSCARDRQAEELPGRGQAGDHARGSSIAAQGAS